MVLPLAEISLTLPPRTSVRNVGLYGTLILFSGGANTATTSQFRTNSASRIVTKRRGLHGSIGWRFGAPLTLRFPRLGSGGGGGVRGSGARASSAMFQLYAARARNFWTNAGVEAPM